MAVSVKNMTIDEINTELDEICERSKEIAAELPTAVVTACPSEILWMDDADRTRRHDLLMEYQSRGASLQEAARQRILNRRSERKLKRISL